MGRCRRDAKAARGAQPWVRAMLVLTQVSSMNTNRVGVEAGLAVAPGLSPAQHVRAILLRRVAGLFLRVMAWRTRKRCIDP